MTKDWLKLAGRKEAGKDGKAEKLCRVGEIEQVGFKARKKLITGERKCFKRKGRSRTDDCGEAVCVRIEVRSNGLFTDGSRSNGLFTDESTVERIVYGYM